MKIATCINCTYFIEKENIFSGIEGFCRFNPPVIVIVTDMCISKFPDVAGDDWCGKFKEQRKDDDK